MAGRLGFGLGFCLIKIMGGDITTPLTVDSTLYTVDSTTITIDQTEI